MAELTYRDAVAAGIAQEMERDDSVVFLGEDIAAAGGVFKATVGLLERFGPDRVRDTPISEQAIVGAAMGAAMTGLRPIAEIMFSDFLAVCWDIIANQIAKQRYMTNGQVTIPLVIRTGNGGVIFGTHQPNVTPNGGQTLRDVQALSNGHRLLLGYSLFVGWIVWIDHGGGIDEADVSRKPAGSAFLGQHATDVTAANDSDSLEIQLTTI